MYTVTESVTPLEEYLKENRNELEISWGIHQIAVGFCDSCTEDFVAIYSKCEFYTLIRHNSCEKCNYRVFKKTEQI